MDKKIWGRELIVLNKLKELLYSYLFYSWLILKGEKAKIQWLTWEITDACNSRCQLCSIWKTKTSPDILTLEEIKKVFRDPILKHLEVILLTGGEPVLRDDLIDIILFIHQILPKVRFTLSTNGILPDKVLKVVSSAIEKGVTIDVGISLDGVGEHHDKVRGVAGNFEKVDYLIKELKKIKEKHSDKLFIVAGLTLHPLTMEYAKEAEAYARKMEVHFLLQLYDEAPYYHNITNRQGAEKLEEENYKMTKVVEASCPSFHNQLLMKILKDKKIKFDCFTMRSFFILRCNGDIMPCLRMSDVKIGNIRQNSLSDIWDGHPAEEARKMVRACEGCANTWATDWSLRCNFWPFSGLLTKFLLKNIVK